MELKFENIQKNYGKQKALKGFSTTLTDGVYGLLGPNGAGKTTLISILTGGLNSDEGKIFLDNEDIRKMKKEYFKRIGYLPQYPVFYKNFYVDEFLDYMATVKNIPRKEAKKRILDVLEMVNLIEDRRKKIGALSGGMRQRLGIAQAILNEPEILILDEPTAGLDPGERIRFRNLISKISKGKLVLMATHIVSDVEHISKEILILKKGHLVMQGTTESLCKLIKEQVYTITCDEKEIEYLSDKYLIANVKRIDDKYNLRVISEKEIIQNGQRVEPSLEDVFLSTFGK